MIIQVDGFPIYVDNETSQKLVKIGNRFPNKNLGDIIREALCVYVNISDCVDLYKNPEPSLTEQIADLENMKKEFFKLDPFEPYEEKK